MLHVIMEYFSRVASWNIRDQSLKTNLFLKLPDKGLYKPGAKASHSHAGHLHEVHGGRKKKQDWVILVANIN